MVPSRAPYSSSKTNSVVLSLLLAACGVAACSGVSSGPNNLTGDNSKSPVSSQPEAGSDDRDAAGAVNAGDDGGSPGDAARAPSEAAPPPPSRDADVPEATPPGDDASPMIDDAGGEPADAGSAQDAPSAPADAASDAATTHPIEASTPTPVVMDVQFFGWPDNQPAGNAIAYPKSAGYPTKHDVASGVGSYADPISFGGDPATFAPGTILYVPYIEKYVIMEDECTSCATQAQTTHRPQITVWMASTASTPTAAFASCEMSWTKDEITAIESPSAVLVATTSPLFDASTRTCETLP
jgi:hypothetical protein